MKKIIIAIIVILSCCRINAQVFTGTVYDKATNQPIADVYVSFNGTTANAITDNSGKFELTVAQRVNTQLVFSHIAYNMVIIENPFDEFPEEIYMEQRINMLDDVIITTKVSPEYADPFTRAQKLRAFREQFLGNTRAGKSCMIMNESDIEFRYNAQTNTLSASSDQPIVVLNEYLGYLVSFILFDFKIEYTVRQSLIEARRSNRFRGSHFDPDPQRRQMIMDNSEIEGAYVLSNNYDIQQSYFTVISLFTDLMDDEKVKKKAQV